MEAIIYTRPSCDQWAKACSCMNLQNIWPTQPFPIHMQRKNDRDMWATFSNCVVYAISTLKFNLKIQEGLFRYIYWTVKYNQCLPSYILESDLESPVLLVLWFSTKKSIIFYLHSMFPFLDFPTFCRTQQLKCIDLCYVLWNVDIPGFLWCFCSWRYW